MKKNRLISGLLLGASVCLLAACGGQKQEVTPASSSTSISSTSSSSSTSTTSVASSSSSQTGLWDAGKAEALRSFMIDQWGPSFSPPQYYVSYSPNRAGNFFGVNLPSGVLTGPGQQMTPDFLGETPELVWSETGQVGAGQTAVVGMYSDLEVSKSQLAHLYLFTIKDGQVIAWITEQNQGNPEKRLYFRPTKNQELQAFFENLVLGESSAVATTSSATVPNTSVDTKNLTIEQAANWAKAHRASEYGSPYNKSDFISQVITNNQSSDGLAYIEVREDHNSANMQAAGADRSVSSGAAFYRVNANGQLEKMDVVAGSYSVVADIYFE
ncbi:Uncharacterised protein [Streptococcus suis]|uniref:DUF4767 domain-containing protein n=1 Tax=Streptococcus suis TaxID=1307 RepID=A0A0Z8ENI7_STRSU|nr:DUF4767 domain-containing protein [Streptococcus suis]NQH34849.1 DUF4767 domain-containing protein [Streptococcus suis]CYU65334.1 Uncharacterised protein [Streptococcus suis]